jgi:hypothetical protein
MSWSPSKIPAMPFGASGLPDPIGAANTAFDSVMTKRETVQAANDIAQLRSLDAPIRALAVAIVGPLTNAKVEVPARIAAWIREKVQYTQETPMIEILQGPYRTLGSNVSVQTPMGPYRFGGTGTGDCDDLSILFACLCRSIGVTAYVAGIAPAAKTDSFFHAMGFSNGVFYELSKDRPYGGLGGKTIASTAPYPNIVATVYDPTMRQFTKIKPQEVPMSGHCDDDCHDCAPCQQNHARAGGMGMSQPFGGAMIPPPQALRPVDALQPWHTVPFNIYLPTRQTSGISMSGSMGVGLSVSGLGTRQLSLGVPDLQVQTPQQTFQANVAQFQAVTQATRSHRGTSVFSPSATSTTAVDNAAAAAAALEAQAAADAVAAANAAAEAKAKADAAGGIGIGTLAIGAAALYFLTR